jgi:hypothetical protein
MNESCRENEGSQNNRNENCKKRGMRRRSLVCLEYNVSIAWREYKYTRGFYDSWQCVADKGAARREGVIA